jgi:fructose-bisphosphate aldolase class II
MTVRYKGLGLVNTREMFQKAIKEGFAVPAYNFVNMEQLQAIIHACVETRSPVILQVSKNVRNYATPDIVINMVRGAMKIIQRSMNHLPVALHLDHGDSAELCALCIEDGYSSVMIDCSTLPFD